MSSRQGTSGNEVPGQNYLEVPLVVYPRGRRVRVGVASVFADGITAHFDANTGDPLAARIVKAITSGAIDALSIAPTSEEPQLTLADYIKGSVNTS